MVTYLVSCNRATRRKVERYMRKYPKLTFTQAYNKLYHTNYAEPYSPGNDTSTKGNN